jgi:hypothetical protein
VPPFASSERHDVLEQFRRRGAAFGCGLLEPFEFDLIVRLHIFVQTLICSANIDARERLELSGRVISRASEKWRRRATEEFQKWGITLRS